MDDRTLMDLFGSLSREIGEVKDGFERIETRLRRHGGIINSGARQRLADWARRLDKLEGKKE
jgi:hypothetical protein